VLAANASADMPLRNCLLVEYIGDFSARCSDVDVHVIL